MVSGSEDAKLYVWDLQSREIVQVLEGHRGRLSAFDCGTVTLIMWSDAVLAVAVSILAMPCARVTNHWLRTQTHPERAIIASASMEKDLTIRLWCDES